MSIPYRKNQLPWFWVQPAHLTIEISKRYGMQIWAAVFAVLFVIPVLGSFADARGSMFICRDKTGSLHFTNVRNSSDCKTYVLKPSERGWSAAASPTRHSQYDRDIRRIARRYSVDPPLIKAIIHTESDFNHTAVSKKGAQGLMQLMPETARELRVANPFNPRENIDGGTRYFRKMLNNFKGNLRLSLAAYNAGPGLVKRTGGVPKIPETMRYIKKVLKQYKYYKKRM